MVSCIQVVSTLGSFSSEQERIGPNLILRSLSVHGTKELLVLFLEE